MAGKTMKVPVGALRFVGDGDAVGCSFFTHSTDSGDTDNVPFKMRLYSGQVLSHWYWERVALDLKGAVGVPETFPVLRQHDTSLILGMGRLESAEGSLEVEGEIIQANDDAREIIALARAGYPWQASGYFVPLKLEVVKQGATAEVNGHTVDGPATIFREYHVREASFCALGADSDTSAAVAATDGDAVELAVEIIGDSQVEEEKAMVEETAVALSYEDWKAGSPDHAVRLSEEATLAERARIQKIQELAGNFTDMGAQAADEVKAGHTPEEAAAAFASVYGARRRMKLTDMETDAPKELAAEEPGDPADTSAMSQAEQQKAAWDADEGLRAEFGGDFKAYAAFKKHEADGSARILTK